MTLQVWAERFWIWLGRPAPVAVSYEVACTCGILMRGHRQPAHQAVRCSGCGRQVFVLPRSPLPALALSTDSLTPRHVLHGLWKRISTIAVVVSAGIVLVGLTIWFIAHQPRRANTSAVNAELETLRRHVRAGQAGFAGGNFQSALDDLESAIGIRARNLNVLPADESRELTHLHKQAALLADQLTESLEEILTRIDSLEFREGEATFNRLYRKKAVVFYASVRRDATGRFEMDYRVQGPRQKKARLELDDLKLLRRLPLQEPQQLLFGARLMGAQRQPDESWIIRLDTESGVLLTDAGAAAACCFQPPDPVHLAAVLERQAAWVTNPP